MIENSDDYEYEIISHDKIMKMKEQIEALQHKLEKRDVVATGKFTETLEQLTKEMERMNALLKAANTEIQKEPPVKLDLKPIADKMDIILDENRKIAQGVLAVADMLKEMKPRSKSPVSPMQARPPMPHRTMAPPGPVPPRSMAPPPISPAEPKLEIGSMSSPPRPKKKHLFEL